MTKDKSSAPNTLFKGTSSFLENLKNNTDEIKLEFSPKKSVVLPSSISDKSKTIKKIKGNPLRQLNLEELNKSFKPQRDSRKKVLDLASMGLVIKKQTKTPGPKMKAFADLISNDVED